MVTPRGPGALFTQRSQRVTRSDDADALGLDVLAQRFVMTMTYSGLGQAVHPLSPACGGEGQGEGVCSARWIARQGLLRDTRPLKCLTGLKIMRFGNSLAHGDSDRPRRKRSEQAVERQREKRDAGAESGVG